MSLWGHLTNECISHVLVTMTTVEGEDDTHAHSYLCLAIFVRYLLPLLSVSLTAQCQTHSLPRLYFNLKQISTLKQDF